MVGSNDYSRASHNRPAQNAVLLWKFRRVSFCLPPIIREAAAIYVSRILFTLVCVHMTPVCQYSANSIYSFINVLELSLSLCRYNLNAMQISQCRFARAWSGKAAWMPCRLTPSPFRTNTGGYFTLIRWYNRYIHLYTID